MCNAVGILQQSALPSILPGRENLISSIVKNESAEFQPKGKSYFLNRVKILCDYYIILFLSVHFISFVLLFSDQIKNCVNYYFQISRHCLRP